MLPSLWIAAPAVGTAGGPVWALQRTLAEANVEPPPTPFTVAAIFVGLVLLTVVIVLIGWILSTVLPTGEEEPPRRRRSRGSSAA